MPKRNKCVLLLSSEHHVAKCSGKEKDYKPDNILDYNSTNVGVSSVNQMVSHFTSQRCTWRWPLALFYTFLNLAALNAYVVYLECKKVKPDRSEFLQDLALELVQKYALQQPKTLHAELVVLNKLVTGKTCYTCHWRGKSVTCGVFTCCVCFQCKERLCKDHCQKIHICDTCNGKNDVKTKNSK